MLARAPPPSLSFPVGSTTGSRRWMVRLGSDGGSVAARAGYSRRPLDTPGAYELIDDSTGEKVIVLGAVDTCDESSPLSSVDRISSLPRVVAVTAKNASRTKGVASSFGRLKAQQVKAIIGKTSRKKQELIRNDDDDDDEQAAEDKVLHQSFSLSSILDSMRKKLIANTISQSEESTELEGRKTLDGYNEADEEISDSENYEDMKRDEPRISYPKDEYMKRDEPRISYPKDAYMKRDERRISYPKDEYMKRDERRISYPKDEYMKRDEPRISYPKDVYIKRDEPRISYPKDEYMKRDESRISYPKGSAGNLRGWGDRRSVRNAKETPDLKKRWNKLSGESDFFSRKTFRELGCRDYMIESLKEQKFTRPSHIQALAFAPVIEGKSCVIADQSGSGKTLAYLAPVIQHLREEELKGLSKSSPKSPRVIVFVPTAELASQVLSCCRAISKFGVPFRSMVVTGGFRQKTQLENLEQGVDVLIATPGRFMFLIKEGFLELTNLRCAVLDEVDILFNDEDFEVALQSLISSSPVTAQYLFVTATLPLEIYNKLVEAFPDCEVIMGPRVHRVSPGLEEVVVDCSGDDKTEKTPETAFLNKKTALLQLVEGSPVSKTIIFCNKIETCRKVENILKRFDRKGSRLSVLPFHAALAQESRLANMKEFTNSHPEGDSLILVCTDRASRGIDFSGVDHVVLFDFPRDPSEYVRRVGRTARGARGKGKAFIFVVGKQVPLARKIMDRNQKGHPVHDVPSTYELTSYEM